MPSWSRLLPPPGLLRTRRRLTADAGAVSVVVLLTLVAAGPLVWRGTSIGQDAAAFFYPMYGFLGERLRAGDIPGWNPYQFAGAPFAADPESGWTYWPAMLLFTVLPLAAAADAFLVGHLLLAGLTTYAYARLLGLRVVGALVAATSYEFAGLIYARSVCCPAYLQLMSWIPPLFLGAELALRGRTWLGRARWWGATGFALSQVFAAWIGQGSYYALLALGGYLAYRTLLAPDDRSAPLRARVVALVLHGAGVLAFGVGLAAAGLLPRLEFHALSTLAGGYEGDLAWAARLGGWSFGEMWRSVLTRGFYYAGVVTIALALAAAPAVRRRFAAPYFLGLAIACLILASQRETPLHRLAYAVLPRFGEFHPHWPERVMVVFYLAPALLAGAATSAIRRTRWIPVALLLLVFVDLRTLGYRTIRTGPFGGFYTVDLEAYYAPGPAGAFLRDRQHADAFRFFGYDPWILQIQDGQQAFYRFQFGDPRTAALVVNNRATVLGLQDVQGYNPLQLARYAEYVRALNRGRSQDYHGAYVMPEGIGSPLLDLLNARYVVVPAEAPPDRTDLQALIRDYPAVFGDGSIRVLENRRALPRAWLVHEARQVQSGEALHLLASGAVDPRRVALLEAPSPILAHPPASAQEQVAIEAYEPDRLRLRSRAAAPGLLMLSEVHYPAWRAYVDGRRIPVLRANHTLRAVPVPAGEHVVELRFESRSLQLGGAISLASYAALALLFGSTARSVPVRFSFRSDPRGP